MCHEQTAVSQQWAKGAMQHRVGPTRFLLMLALAIVEVIGVRQSLDSGRSSLLSSCRNSIAGMADQLASRARWSVQSAALREGNRAAECAGRISILIL